MSEIKKLDFVTAGVNVQGRTYSYELQNGTKQNGTIELTRIDSCDNGGIHTRINIKLTPKITGSVGQEILRMIKEEIYSPLKHLKID